jgi:wyosine [tRNA(Phe)-imidazoG37] synthetase (radical SAM superfamily)
MTPVVQGIHLEPTNICTLKCPGCPRTRFIDKWPSHWQNHSIDTTVLLRFLDIELSDIHVELCGNYGDPIYHPDLAGLIRGLKDRGAVISIVTNASHRKKMWWQELVQELSAGDSVTFSIDGIPDNFTQYRINGDWPTIEDAIKVCAEAPCDTVWSFIPFAYNQNNIEQARQLSQDLGIDRFQINRSARFDEQTMHFKPSDDLVGNEWHSQQNWKKTITAQKVIPECSNGQTHFISADGHYMPCCYLGDHRFYYKNEFGKNRKQYQIADTTLSDILNRSQVTEFYRTLDDHSACQFNCGA